MNESVKISISESAINLLDSLVEPGHMLAFEQEIDTGKPGHFYIKIDLPTLSRLQEARWKEETFSDTIARMAAFLGKKETFCNALRVLYFNTWNREWPEADEYMLMLAKEETSREGLLTLMRECHEF